jgi:GxxExxY protein
MKPITEKIIGCAIEVHRILRCGLYESVYRAALSIEFDAAGVKYAREVRFLRSTKAVHWESTASTSSSRIE